MPCNWIKIGNTVAHIRTTGRRAQKCFYCGKASDFLCDYPVGKTKLGKKKDCDRPLCGDHTQKGISPTVDFAENITRLQKRHTNAGKPGNLN